MNARQIAKIAASATLALGLVQNTFAADETFQASMKLLAPIVITESQALSFADTVAGQANEVSTGADEATAAIFTATGEADRDVTGSVVEDNITMTTGDGIGTTKQITVDQFSTGGDMDASGGASFDTNGQLNDLRIGGTANVEAEDIAGDYVGTATFRLVYN